MPCLQFLAYMSFVMHVLTLILIFNCPSVTGTTDTGGVMRGTERCTAYT